MNKKVTISLFFLLVLTTIYFLFIPIRVREVSYEIKDKNIEVHIKLDEFTTSGACILNEKSFPIENQECVIPIPNEKTEIEIATKWNKINYLVNPEIDEVIDFKMSKTLFYLAIGEEQKVDLSIEALGNPEIVSSFQSENEKIVMAKNNIIVGVGNGKTKVKVTVGRVEKEIEVIVTNLITKPTLTPNKAYLKCGIYTEEDNKLLDEILEYRINEAGIKTRAGVVAALRFLTLEFPYQLNYFFENGRLNNNTGGNYVDGEGRFYHKGLYLHSSKFKMLEKTKYGPSIWGCPLTNWQDEAGFLPGVRYPNGLDCSGFITWAMYNGGFDPKDTGAGDNPWADDDLSDLGVHLPITMDLLESNTLKAGDIIATDGHIAMIGGIKDRVVYVAESTTYWHGVVMHPYTYEELVRTYMLDYIIRMDHYYQNDGNYTEYW